MEREAEINQIAYRIWEEEGRPEGRDLEHYLRAKEIWQRNHSGEPFGTSPGSAPRRSTRPKSAGRKRSTPPKAG